MIYKVKTIKENGYSFERYYESLQVAKVWAIRTVNEDKEWTCIIQPCKFVEGVLTTDYNETWYQYDFSKTRKHITCTTV